MGAVIDIELPLLRLRMGMMPGFTDRFFLGVVSRVRLGMGFRMMTCIFFGPFLILTDIRTYAGPGYLSFGVFRATGCHAK